MKHNELSHITRQHYFQPEPFDAMDYANAVGQHYDRTARHHPTPEFVGELFEAASPEVRLKIVEQLIRPLGVLPLVTVADGVFAKVRFKRGWPELNIQQQDIATVQRSDVARLAAYVQQEDEHVLHGLLRMLTTGASMH